MDSGAVFVASRFLLRMNNTKYIVSEQASKYDVCFKSLSKASTWLQPIASDSTFSTLKESVFVYLQTQVPNKVSTECIFAWRGLLSSCLLTTVHPGQVADYMKTFWVSLGMGPSEAWFSLPRQSFPRHLHISTETRAHVAVTQNRFNTIFSWGIHTEQIEVLKRTQQVCVALPFYRHGLQERRHTALDASWCTLNWNEKPAHRTKSSDWFYIKQDDYKIHTFA